MAAGSWQVHDWEPFMPGSARPDQPRGGLVHLVPAGHSFLLATAPRGYVYCIRLMRILPHAGYMLQHSGRHTQAKHRRGRPRVGHGGVTHG